MRRGKVPMSHAKALLILILACAFLAVLATLDTAEQYRTWKAARAWTPIQQATARALDADAMYMIVLAALSIETAAFAASCAGGLSLGLSIATGDKGTFRTAKIFAWIGLGLGVAYSAAIILYQVRVGSRAVLKGPVFDYSLRMQIPVGIAVAGFPVLMGAYLVYLLRNRQRTE